MKKDELLVPKNYRGVNAIFARGFTEYYLMQDRDEPIGLRECQDAGNEMVKSFEEQISVPYISRLASELKAANIFKGMKVGRKHYLTDGPNIEDWENFLFHNEDYGSRLTGSAEQDQQRIDVLAILEEHGAVRANGPHNPIPTAAYKLLNQMVKDGRLDVIFLKADLPAGVKYQGETHRVGFFND